MENIDTYGYGKSVTYDSYGKQTHKTVMENMDT